MVDYSKWDKLDDGSDEEGDGGKGPAGGVVEEERRSKLRQELAELLAAAGVDKEGAPALPEVAALDAEGRAGVLAAFAARAARDPGTDHNLERHCDVLELVRQHRWLLREGRDCAAALYGRLFYDFDKGTFARRRELLLEVTNTLEACSSMPTPVEFFEAVCMPRSAASRSMREKYEQMGYARDAICRRKPVPEPDDGGWWWAALLALCALLCVAAAAALYWHTA